MKACPFCAEEIQDAAIVCKHCRRDLVKREPDPPPVAVVAPKKTTSVAARLGLLLVGIIFLGRCASQLATPTRSTTSTVVPGGQPEPDEPCSVEAPASARAAAQNWCEGGVFTRVNVSIDANNFVVMLQFSKKGQRTWADRKDTILNKFRQITDEMVEKTDINTAFSLHDTNGQLLGGCARKRAAHESTCNSR